MNLGIVLLAVLLLGVAVYCAAELQKQSVRTAEVNDIVTGFYDGLGSFYTWPSDMPDADVDELNDDKEKYYPYLDKGFEKIKPYLYDNAALYKEMKDGAFYFLTQNIMNGRKPVEVSFDLMSRDVELIRDAASVELILTANIRTEDNRNLSIKYFGNISLEYVNGKWVVVDQSMYTE